MADEVGEAFFQKIVGLTNLMFGLGMFFFFRKKSSKHRMLEDDVGIFLFFCSFFFSNIFNVGGNFC